MMSTTIKEVAVATTSTTNSNSSSTGSLPSPRPAATATCDDGTIRTDKGDRDRGLADAIAATETTCLLGPPPLTVSTPSGSTTYDDDVFMTHNRGHPDTGEDSLPCRSSSSAWFCAYSVVVVAFVAIALFVRDASWSKRDGWDMPLTDRERSDAPQSTSAYYRDDLAHYYKLELEGNKRKKAKDNKKKTKASEHEQQDRVDVSYCEDGKYSKRTLQLAYELPLASLFRENKGQKKYEASSVVVKGEYAYAVCDSSWSISKFNRQLQPFASDNVQIGDPQLQHDADNIDFTNDKEDSGYEALFWDEDVFYVVRESVQQGKDQTYHAIIEQIVMATTTSDNGKEEESYDVLEACPCEFEFEGDSKGFEGAIGIRDLNNELVVLGLCEGNYCSERRKNEKGNGRLVAMKRALVQPSDGSPPTCQWSTLRTINIPPSANFRDYSAITLNYDTGRVAISSQEESQLWIGTLVGMDPTTKLWDIANLEFDTSKAGLRSTVVYDFPRNDNCQVVYCNVEGVHWLNEEMIIAVSDKMKSAGKQDFRCFEKDQSVHVFVLP